MKLLILNDSSKVKITSVKPWRVNFRYGERLFSLIAKGDCSEDWVELRESIGKKWICVGTANYERLKIEDVLRSKYTKNHISMWHICNGTTLNSIDIEYFFKSMHSMKLIYCGVDVEKEMLLEMYEQIKEAKKVAKEDFNNRMKNLEIREKVISKKLKALEEVE